jgi:hypothetical protein
VYALARRPRLFPPPRNEQIEALALPTRSASASTNSLIGSCRVAIASLSLAMARAARPPPEAALQRKLLVRSLN